MSAARHERLPRAADPAVLVDGHVHFHECFTWRRFLDAAAANFARARRSLGLTDASPGCLMFTESAGVNQYRSLVTPGQVEDAGWQVENGDDDCSAVLRRGEGETIVVVAGRQIVTAEGLEVLALGCTRELADGQPIRHVLREVAKDGALGVVPWGFGKWWGRRGRILRGLIDDPPDAWFCLGDNGGRAAILRSGLFDLAESREVPVLGGSDPLPMPHQVGRAGSYGFILAQWRMTRPLAAAIKAQIQALRHSPPVFGRFSSVPAMMRSQLEMRWLRIAAESR